MFAFPDNGFGHLMDSVFPPAWKAFGAKTTSMFYPDTQQDLSSLGTKVATTNPAIFMTVTSGLATDSLVMNAVAQAGYKGQMLAAMLTIPMLFCNISQRMH